MSTLSLIFKFNGSQVVRLPKDIAFPDDVKHVAVWRDGNRCILAPADTAWDDFFETPGIDLPERTQPKG